VSDPYVSTRHPHLTGVKGKIVDALHRDVGWMLADDIAIAAGVSRDYGARMLSELVEEGLVERAYDGGYHGRGKPPYIYSCCGS